MKKGAEKMLTIREAAAAVGAAEITIRKWAKAGKLKGARLEESPAGQYWLIPESAIADMGEVTRGRPRKPLSELKSKPRRKAQSN
jgi:excisionase family DNA binding protein